MRLAFLVSSLLKEDESVAELREKLIAEILASINIKFLTIRIATK
jgi:hypothetical protein